MPNLLRCWEVRVANRSSIEVVLRAAVCSTLALAALTSCQVTPDNIPRFYDAPAPSAVSVATDGEATTSSRCASFKGQRLYVGADLGFVVVFDAAASGSPKPLCAIRNIFGEIGGLAIDLGGDLVVSNESVPALTLYAHGANGKTVQPKAVIQGSNTLLLPFYDSPWKGIG